MNCLDFRRQMLADPFCRDEDMLAHEADCPACAPVRPRGPGTGSACCAAPCRRSPRRRAWPSASNWPRASINAPTVRRRWWYSAAATVLMAIGVSMVSLFSTSLERGNVALAQSVINHIEDESSHLREARPVIVGRLNRVFERFGAQLAGDIGTVQFRRRVPDA